MWTFTRRSVTSHSIWPLIYKNHFRFKKCFNIASTTNEHFYLKYHSVGYLTMYYVLLKGSNSLFTCNADIPRLFVIWISFTNVFTLKGWSTSYFRRLDCVSKAWLHCNMCFRSPKTVCWLPGSMKPLPQKYTMGSEGLFTPGHFMRFLWSDIYLICIKHFHLHLAT